MFHVLIDTSVWLDLAQDPKQTPLLLVVENLVKAERLKVIVPQIVVEEFRKNRDRVAKSSSRSLSGLFQQVKEAVKKATIGAERKNAIVSELEDLNHQIPLIGGAAAGVLDRVEELFKVAGVQPTDHRAVHCAALRALSRRAPCHHENKNSIADAVVIETYGVVGSRLNAHRK